MSFLSRYFYFTGSLVLTGYLLLIIKPLLVPCLAGLILALALKPFVANLEKIKIPRLMSTFIAVSLCIILSFWLVVFFTRQISGIDFRIYSTGVDFTGFTGKIQNWITDVFGIPPQKQISILQESMLSFLKTTTYLVNNTLSFTTNFVSSFVLFVISLFFFLYYRQFLVHFLYQLLDKKKHEKLKDVLIKIQSAVSSYILGLSSIILIVAVLNVIGLVILGIEHAFLFGVFAALLTLLPYVGIFIGSLFPAFFALLTKDSLWYSVGVISIFMLIQFLEGNFLTPNIIGKKISINPFAAILGLIIGGSLLDIPGIILALPLLAIIKVICDEIDFLKPVGFLLGTP